MDATEGGPENGWLRTYLESRFDAIDRRLDGLGGKVDDLAGRVSAIEAGRRESRRLWQGVRDWASPFVTALVGAWAVWRGQH